MAKKSKAAVEATAESNENAIALHETEGLSQGQIIRTRFFRHKPAVISLIGLILITIFVFSASGIHLGTPKKPITIPGWWPHTITELDDTVVCKGAVGCPNLAHPFGQDPIGHDYFALVMRGAEQSIMVMLIVGFIGGLLGTVIGAISGYFRGWVDAVLMRFTDFIITIPSIIIGAVIGFKFGNLGVVALAVYLGLFSWTGLSRLVRGEFLSLREREFVDAARVAGASNRRIIFKHILPNAMGVIIVSVTLMLSGAILLETALSYIGFGVQSPDVSLGSLISEYQDSFTTSSWLFYWPGVLIISIALCVNFIGDGLRDAFDPRQRRRITRKDIIKATFSKRKQDA
jgi:ABC-type dipeptide/oligopeptide/nickel transport system permease subunit